MPSWSACCFSAAVIGGPVRRTERANLRRFWSDQITSRGSKRNRSFQECTAGCARSGRPFRRYEPTPKGLNAMEPLPVKCSRPAWNAKALRCAGESLRFHCCQCLKTPNTKLRRSQQLSLRVNSLPGNRCGARPPSSEPHNASDKHAHHCQRETGRLGCTHTRAYRCCLA